MNSYFFREVKEESGVDVTEFIKKSGIIEFTFEKEDFLMEVHVYRSDGFTGEPVESDGKTYP